MANMNNRDDFTPKTKTELAHRAGHKCSNPDCRKPTSGPHEQIDKHINIGEAAHICAAAIGGKRYNESMTQDERKNNNNGIWLCSNYAKLIDNDDIKYTVKLIREWKLKAENEAESEVRTNLYKTPNQLEIDNAKSDREKSLIELRAESYNSDFIKTAFYKNALAWLIKNNIILLSGLSGMGKTSTSIMIANSLKENHSIFFKQSIAINELAVLAETLENNPTKYEIIILDDFLGQTLLEVERLVYIEKIFESVLGLSQIKLILNSRDTILNELEARNKSIFDILKHRALRLKIEFNDINERKEILESYLKKHEIPEAYIKKILAENEILEHPQFSPLVVDHTFKWLYDVKTDECVAYILNKLEKHSRIWEKEINALNQDAKIYLYTLYSLTNSFIDKETVEKCYRKRVDKNRDELGTISLNNIVNCLKDILFFEEDKNSKSKISVRHPSLNEYLTENISEREIMDIIDSSIYIASRLTKLALTSAF